MINKKTSTFLFLIMSFFFSSTMSFTQSFMANAQSIAIPTITDSDRAILSETSGGKDASKVFSRINARCDFSEETSRRRRSSSFDKDVCVQSAPSNGALDLATADFKVTQNTNCSSEGPLRAGRGTNTTIRTEVEQYYGRAIDLAVQKGDLQAKVRLEAMRNYALSVISVNAATDTVYGHIKAVGGGWPFGYTGKCGGYLTVDYIQLIP